MKKLEIHRDTQEPSLESMQQHMNFEEVLNRATASSATPTKGISKGWIIAGVAVGAIVVGSIFYISNDQTSAITYQSEAMEHTSIQKITHIEPIVEEVTVQISVTPTSPNAVTAPIPPDGHDNTPIVPDKIYYFYPVVVSSIAFPFDEGFGLREQWQQFPELSIYDHLAFQPIDKLQSSLLKVSWEKVVFNKDANGQYYLTLIKGDQAVYCAVAPVFEKEDYVHALEVYQAHQ